MTVLTIPAGVNAMGQKKWVFHPTASSLTAPSLALWTGGSAVDLSCYFYAGSPKMTRATNKVTAPRRACTTQTYQKLGQTTWDFDDASWMVDPQAAAGSAGKKAMETCAPGVTGFLLLRPGLDAVNTDLALGCFVRVCGITFGQYLIDGDESDEAAEFMGNQSLQLNGLPGGLVAMAA
jgi:hypothetical protein